MKRSASYASGSAGDPLWTQRWMHLQRYLLAVLSVATALAMALLLQHFHFRDAAVPLLLFAGALSSWYAGTGPALLAVILSSVGFDYFFVPPIYTLAVEPTDFPYFIIFASFTSLISGFAAARRRGEQALRESETRVRTFIDHASDAFFMLDFEKAIILDVNQPACESLGYTREELIGKTPLAFDVNLDRATLDSVAGRAAAGENVLFDRHWHRRSDGSMFPVEIHTSLFSHDGRRLLLKVARNISDRVRAEEETERLHKLEAELAHTNRVSMMGELAASIAHEVNQPLSGIVNNASACLRWLAAGSPDLEEVREATRDIVRDGKRAGDVIARIRTLTSRAAVARDKLDLNDTIREVLNLVGAEAKKKGVIIGTQFADELSPVAGDRVQLQQVVLNLVMNAIEAMSSVSDRPRELVITTGNIDTDRVQVTVEDSGISLDPNTRDKIFDSFYTTKPGGMGMGLSICRSILHAHGGQLWAAGKQGPGTVFNFTVPKFSDEGSNGRVGGV